MRWGLGPPFYYEWLMTSRRWQAYAGRALFIACLLAGLTVVWISDRPRDDTPTLQQLAKVGESFFYAIAGIQMTLVLLAAPAFAAGAICVDKERGVLLHQLVTDLSNVEIVLGKLASRLLATLSLLFATLPVVALAVLLGGIDPEAMIGTFLVSVGVAVFGTTLALTLSVWANKTHEVLLATYAFSAVYLLICPVYSIMAGPPPVELLQTNPYWLAMAHYLRPDTVEPMDYVYFLGGALAASLVLIVLAILTVRRVVRGGWSPWHWLGRMMARPGFRSLLLLVGFIGTDLSILALDPKHKMATIIAAGIAFLVVHIALGRTFRKSEPAPHPRDDEPARPGFRLSVLAKRRSPAAQLERDPLGWRERRRKRPSAWVRIVCWLYIGGVVFFTILALGQVIGGWRIDGELPALVNAFTITLGMLLLSVSSVTSLAEDRHNGTLELLLTAPVSTFEIVRAKWWGVFRSVPLLALPSVLLAIPLSLKYGTVFPELALIGMIFCYGAAITTFGLALATWFRRTAWALAVSVTTYVLVTVGWVFAVMVMVGRNGPDSIAGGLVLVSPFWGPGLLTIAMEEHNHMFGNDLPFWVFFWFTVIGLGAVVLLLRVLSTFDRCVGRATVQTQSPAAPSSAGGDPQNAVATGIDSCH